MKKFGSETSFRDVFSDFSLHSSDWKSLKQEENCEGVPKVFSLGIAPRGLIAVGVVPMGVVSIGAVSMGVFSVGVVGMGLFNICLVGCGLIVYGVKAMGLF